jgi:hypothetical protein
VSLSTTEVSFSETDPFAVVSFSRAGDTSAPVTISYQIIGDDATEGVDFEGGVGSVVIPAGARTASIQVPIIDDDLSEPTESFVVSILSVSSGVLNAPRTTRVNILDDENPVVIEPEPPLTSRYEVTEVDLWQIPRANAMQFMPGREDILMVADQIGRVWAQNIETGERTRFINLSDEVNFGQGMQGMALHPDFQNQPYVYLYYSVDPPDSALETGNAGLDGGGNRFQWLVRIEADPAADYLRAVPGSKVVLLGGAAQSLDDISGRGELRFSEGPPYADQPATDQINLSPAEIAAGLEYRQNVIKGDGDHIGGGMAFGPDGMLYLAIGDNAAFNFADPRAFSVQDVNSLNGKVVRIDPITGAGLADNPFVQPGDSLDLNRAKVFQYGLRNPFNISFNSDGELVITDVGHANYEEINIGAPGANFGWPFYEGADYDSLFVPPNYRPTPQNGFQDEWDAFLASNPQVALPFKGFSHRDLDPGFQIQAIVGGSVEYSGDRYPESLKGRYFFSDYPDGEVFTIDLDDRDSAEFLYSRIGTAPIRFVEGADGYVYYLRPTGGQIGRLEISEIEPVERTIGSVIRAEGVDHLGRSFSYGDDVELDNPVFFTTVSQVGGDPVSVLFSGIGATEARVFLKEPDASDRPMHAPETVSILALEAGAWTIGDGRQLLVGTVDVGASAVSVQFDLPFASRPLLLTQVQSSTGEPEWGVVRTWGLDGNGFSMRIQDERFNNDSHAPARVGFMAIDYLDPGADVFEWGDTTAQAFSSGERVTQRWTEIGLSTALGDDPLAAAAITSYRAPNPANLRADVQDGRLSLRVQEQEPLPEGVDRTPERAHGVAFDGEGVLTGIDLLI